MPCVKRFGKVHKQPWQSRRDHFLPSEEVPPGLGKKKPRGTSSEPSPSKRQIETPCAILGSLSDSPQPRKGNLHDPNLPHPQRRLGHFPLLTALQAPPQPPKVLPSRRSLKMPDNLSLEDRPNLDGRTEFGHWEMDTIVSGIHGKDGLLVLIKRQTRCCFIENSSASPKMKSSAPSDGSPQRQDHPDRHPHDRQWQRVSRLQSH